MAPVVAIITAVAGAATAAVSAAAIAAGSFIASISAGIASAGLFGKIAVSIGLSFVSSLLQRGGGGGGGGSGSAPQRVIPESVTRTLREAIGSRIKIYGRGRYGGQAIFQRQEKNTGVVAGSNQNTMFLLVAVCDGEIDQVDGYYIDAVEVQVNGSGVTTDGDAEGSARFQVKLGTETQTAFDDLVDNFDDVDETWKGVGAGLLLFEAAATTSNSFELFPNGYRTTPNIVGNFRKVLDPRSIGQAAAYTANAAAVIMDHLIGSDLENGMRLPIELIDLDSFSDAVDYCDEEVAGPLGTTRKRWELHGAVSYDERPIDALKRMLKCCNGQLTYDAEGKIGLSLGKWYEPTLIITDDMLFSSDRDSGSYDSERGTVIKASYTSEDHGFVTQDAVEYVHANEAIWGRRISDVDFPMSNNHGQTRHLQKLTAARLNSPKKLTNEANLLALNVQFERYIRIQSAASGIDAVFEVQPSPIELADEQSRLFGVRFECIQVTQDDVEYNELVEGVDPPIVPDPQVDTSKPDTPTVAASVVPGGIQVTLSNAKTDNNHFLRFAKYNDVTEEYDNPDSLAFAEGSLTALITGLIDGATYEIDAKAVSSGARTSDYSNAVEVDFIANPTPPQNAENVSGSSPAAGEIEVTFTLPNDPNVAGSRVYGSQTDDAANATLIDTKFGTANTSLTCSETGLATGDYYRWVATINGSGVEATRVPTGLIAVS